MTMNTWIKPDIKNSVYSIVNEFITLRGYPPTSREWDNLKFTPSRGTIRKHLNMSLNELLHSLGFSTSFSIKSPLNREEIINAFRRFYKETNKIPTTKDLKSTRLKYLPSISNLYKYFESISDVLIEADLPISSKGYSESYLLMKLDQFIKVYGRLPSKKDLVGLNRNVSFPEYRSFGKLGGIKKALLKLNYSNDEINNLLHLQNKSKIEDLIILTIKEHITKNNTTPGSKEWDQCSYQPSRKEIEKMFGMPFNSLIIKFGFKPKNKTPLSYNKEELSLRLKSFYIKTGRVPTFNDLRNLDNSPHPKIYYEVFGSFEAALKFADLPSNKYLDKDFLISEIIRYIETYGIVPSTNSFRYNNDFPSLKAYKRIWGSFNNAIVELGMTPICCEVRNAFSKRCLSLDKDICNSYEEAFIDNFMFKNDINHEREIPYPYHPLFNKSKLKRCDFLVKDTLGNIIYVEYAGLYKKPKYKMRLDEKIALAKDLNLNLIVIYPYQLGNIYDIFIESNIL